MRPALLLACLALILAPSAEAGENPAGQPPFGAEPLADLAEIRPGDPPPPGFALEPAEVIAVAAGTEAVREELAEQPAAPRVSARGDDRWQVDYIDAGGVPRAQVVVADADGRVLEAWRDHQVEVKLARGYEDAVAGDVSEWWIWLPMCLLFLLPFLDPRRPFRLLHLDMLAMLAFGVSHFFFNRGEIALSVPLVYPVLAYLFIRLAIAGLFPRLREGAIVPRAPIRWLAIGAVVLALVRIGINLADSQVIDIGFAGVAGADRIADGKEIYDGELTPLIDRGDSYGPANYLVYVPFEQALPWGGGLEPLPAAHAAAIFFDLLVVGLLILLGRRLRAGPEGAALGIVLAYAWLAYPYTLYALNANGNDALVAAGLVGALLVLGSAPARGAVLGLAAAAKFGPLALAPLFAAGTGERRWRAAVVFTGAFAAVWALVLLPLLPDGGLREFYDRTFGYQASRGSPFSVWGLAPSLEWLQDVARAVPVLIGLALFFAPRLRTPVQVAALGAALLIATQVGSEHWFYFFILWWTPYALVAFFGEHREVSGVREPRSLRPERTSFAALPGPVS